VPEEREIARRTADRSRILPGLFFALVARQRASARGCAALENQPIQARLRLDSRELGFLIVGKSALLRVYERRLIAVAPFGVLWRRCRIFRNGYCETLLEQFAHVGFDAHVG